MLVSIFAFLVFFCHILEISMYNVAELLRFLKHEQIFGFNRTIIGKLSRESLSRYSLYRSLPR